MSSLIPYSPNDLGPKLDSLEQGLSEYLGALGLPRDKILVNMVERGKVIKNLPEIVSTLPQEILDNCVYISKFAAACAVGLFDAALNFLWDEVIANLRKKVARFDLGYFFDSAITNPDKRKDFRNEDDLSKLDDWELIRGARQIGVLSEIGFKHLDYIRDMRNWASAAHPNQTELTGFQLISWLETCIAEVIAKEPEGPSVIAGQLLHNLRENVLNENDAVALEAPIQRLPVELADSLLRTVFGLFVDPRLNASIKNNIRLIAKSIWDVSSDDVRYEIGVRYATFSANADIDKKELSRQFLEIVEGLTYLNDDTRAVEMNEFIVNLETAHYGFNNFYNEPPHARALSRYVPDSGAIPTSIRYKYVKIIVMCHIGNGYGISIAASGYYNRMISLLQEREIVEFVKLLFDEDFVSRLQFEVCYKKTIILADQLKQKTTNVYLRRLIDMITTSSKSNLIKLGKDAKYISAVNSIKL